LTQRALEKRMAELLHNPVYRENARRVAAAMRREDGVKTAADCVEEAIGAGIAGEVL
jgi:UDP:flavonoid glycosyltransferase YjiC (YdhE family)